MADLVKIEQETTMGREEAAAALRRLADSLARHNDLEFERDGLRYTVEVPDQVRLGIEIEVGTDGGELEVEISW